MNKLHPEAVKAFDSAAKELIGNLGWYKPSNIENNNTPLSSDHREFTEIDLAEFGAIPIILRSHNIDTGVLNSIIKYIDEGQIGLDGERIEDFNKLVKSIYKKVDWISYSVLEDRVFEYLVDFYKKKYEKGLSAYLEEWQEKNVRIYQFFFIVRGISIETPFRVGNTIISYKSNDSFNKIFETIKVVPQDWQQEMMRRDFNGNVVITCAIDECEEQKAKELALETSIRSVDAIKLFSDVLTFPSRSVRFDLEHRFVETGRKSNMLILSLDLETKEPYSVRMGLESEQPSSSFTINAKGIEQMARQGFAYIHELLIKKDKKLTVELEELVLENISRFADSLSQSDLHKRIAQVFTGLESLTLKNSEVGILESMKKYLPKILTKDTEQREQIQKDLSDLYKVRSQYMHHGIKSEIDLQKLRRLQLYLRGAILRYLEMSKDYKDKEGILNAIDDAINKAF
ncbi:hypothetical protein [Lewinella sp. LCG006]|uniref:hypothetical protein n=1 Tax=Lewinella sp. LCG006 TaxID=3231911 RepID=UPI00345F25E2